jgi:hypothetical protein
MSEFEKRNLKPLDPLTEKNVSNFRDPKKIDLQKITLRGLFFGGLISAGLIGSSINKPENTQVEGSTKPFKSEHNNSQDGGNANAKHTTEHYSPILHKLEILREQRHEYCTKDTANKTACDFFINPLGESPKILIPFIPVVEYYDLKNEQLEKEVKLKEKLGDNFNLSSQLITELENFSHILFSLTKEELLTENLVIYLLAFLPKVQHYLFFVLVSKARLTTFACNKAQKQVAKLDKALNTLYQKLAKTEQKQNIAFGQNTKPIQLATVFDEIKALRNTMVQVKLALQVPMFLVKHKGNMTETYLGMSDLAAPRFSSIFLPKPDEVTPESIYKTIKGEKDCSLVWEESLDIFSQKFGENKNQRDLFWVQRNVKLPERESFTTYDLPEFEYDDPTKIKNEDKISEVQRLMGYHEYYGVKNMEKLRLLFHGLELLSDKVLNYIPDFEIEQYEPNTVSVVENGDEADDIEELPIKATPKNFSDLLQTEIKTSLQIEYDERSKMKKVKINDWELLLKYAFMIMDQATKNHDKAALADSSSDQNGQENMDNSSEVGRDEDLSPSYILSNSDKKWLTGCAKFANEFKFPIDIFQKPQEPTNWQETFELSNLDSKYSSPDKLDQEADEHIKESEYVNAYEYHQAPAQEFTPPNIDVYEKYKEISSFVKNPSTFTTVTEIDDYSQSYYLKITNYINAIFETAPEMRELFEGKILEYKVLAQEDFGIKNWRSLRAYNSGKHLKIMARRLKALYLGLTNQVYEAYSNKVKFTNSQTPDPNNFNMYLDRIKNSSADNDFTDYSKKMPSWTIFAPNFFNETFLTFLHYYRARSDLANLMQKKVAGVQVFGSLAPKATLDQKVNIWSTHMTHDGVANIPEMRTKIDEYLFEADLIHYWFKTDSPPAKTTPDQKLDQINQEKFF